MAKTYSFGSISSNQWPDGLPFRCTTLGNNSTWYRSKSEHGEGALSVPVFPVCQICPPSAPKCWIKAVNPKRCWSNWPLAPLTWRSCVPSSIPYIWEHTRDVHVSLWLQFLPQFKSAFWVVFSNRCRLFPKRSLKTVPPPQCPEWTQTKRLCKNEFGKKILKHFSSHD